MMKFSELEAGLLIGVQGSYLHGHIVREVARHEVDIEEAAVHHGKGAAHPPGILSEGAIRACHRIDPELSQ